MLLALIIIISLVPIYGFPKLLFYYYATKSVSISLCRALTKAIMVRSEIHTLNKIKINTRCILSININNRNSFYLLRLINCLSQLSKVKISRTVSILEMSYDTFIHCSQNPDFLIFVKQQKNLEEIVFTT